MSAQFKVGETVKVFDRYRLGSREVLGTVSKHSDTNDGIAVKLLDDPGRSPAIETTLWLRPQQLISCVIPNRALTIADVRQGLEHGSKFYRKGWNGKAMFVVLQTPDKHSKMTLPYVYLVYGVSLEHPDGVERVPWAPSQTDFLADDWVRVTI